MGSRHLSGTGRGTRQLKSRHWPGVCQFPEFQHFESGPLMRGPLIQHSTSTRVACRIWDDLESCWAETLSGCWGSLSEREEALCVSQVHTEYLKLNRDGIRTLNYMVQAESKQHLDNPQRGRAGEGRAGAGLCGVSGVPARGYWEAETPPPSKRPIISVAETRSWQAVCSWS